MEFETVLGSWAKLHGRPPNERVGAKNQRDEEEGWVMASPKEQESKNIRR